MTNQLVVVALAFILTSTIGYSQADGVLIMNQEIKVTFPGAYKEEKKGAVVRYKLQLADSTADMFAIAQDLSASGLTRENFKEQIKNDQFWKDYVQGYTARIPNFKLVKFKKTNVTDTPAIEIDLKSNDSSDTLHQLILIVGTTNYIFSFKNRSGKANKKVKELFFEGVQLVR